MYRTGLIAMTAFILSNCGQHPGRVITLPAMDPTISVRLLFAVGSQNDPAGQEGIAYLTAQMLTNASTLKNSYDQILQKLYPLAAGYSAQVDKELTVIEGRAYKDKWEEYYLLLREAVLEPAFKEEDYKRIQSETLNYLENILRYSNDEELGKQALNQFIFTATSYGHPEAGLINSVKKITLNDIREFYKHHFTSSNLTIAVGGQGCQEIVPQLDHDFAALPPFPPVETNTTIPQPIEGLEVLLIEKDTESTAISFGYPIDLQRSDEDFFAMWLMNSWFGEHRNASSHLYQVIREARGLNYGDYSYIEAFPQGSARQFPATNVARRSQIFQVWIRPVPNEARHFALRAAVRELQRMVDNGLTPEQFQLTQKFLSKYYLHFAPTTTYRLGYLLDDRFYNINNFLQIFPQKIGSLTVQQVNSAIKKYLQYQNIKIVMVTKDAENLKRDLVENRPSPMTYRTPKPQSVLDEDREIEKYPLDVKADKVTIVKVQDMLL